MKNIRYLLLFFLSVLITNANARDGHAYLEGLERILITKASRIPVLPSEESVGLDPVEEPEPVPSPYQIVLAEDAIIQTVNNLTLADILAGLRGGSSSKLASWSSEKVIKFMGDYDREYTEIGIAEKRRKLTNLQRELENIKASKKKKKKKEKIADLQEKVSTLESEIHDFLWFENPLNLSKIKVNVVHKAHEYTWAFSVKLGLESEDGIPERFLRPIKDSLEYFVDI